MEHLTYHMAYAKFVSTKKKQYRTSSSISSATSSSSSSSSPTQRSSSSNKSISKSQKFDFFPVRYRVEFSKDQLKRLEAEYREKAYLSDGRHMKIADDLGLTDKNVLIWFQNRRRKDKKAIIGNGNKVTSPSSQCPELQKLSQNTLPVFKPLAAQIVKRTEQTVRKEFNPQLIVKMPLSSSQAPKIPEALEEQLHNGSTLEEELQQFLRFKPKTKLKCHKRSRGTWSSVTQKSMPSEQQVKQTGYQEANSASISNYANFQSDWPTDENPTEQHKDSFLDLSIDSNISFGFLGPNNKDNLRTDDLIDI